MIYKFRYLKLLIFFSTFILKLVFLGNAVFAQNIPVPDDTLGNENSRVEGFNNIDVVTGGTRRGSNLFHSFREFNVDVGREVYFFAPSAEIQNILARVTGSSRSEILGVLGTRVFDGSNINPSNANLFLINPNGIVFGEGARLDIGGSFVATTADGIQFAEQDFFSATQPQQSSLLSITPGTLFFQQVRSQPGNIINRGNLRTTPKNLTLVADNLDLQGQLFTIGGNLKLQANNTVKMKNAIVFSNNIDILGRSLTVSDRTSIAVGATQENTGSISVKVDDFVSVDGSFITSIVTGNTIGNGDIRIEGDSISLSGDSQVDTSVLGSGKAGDIFIKADNLISLVGNPDRLASTGIFSRLGTGNIGKSGDINIETDSLSLSGGQISASTFGEGDAGNVTIQADKSVSLLNQSIIFSDVGSDAIGDGGEINIKTGSFLSKDGSQLLAIIRRPSLNGSNVVNKNAGNINLEVRNTATIIGKPLERDNLTGIDRLASIATAVDQGASGNAGSISIKADKLLLTNFASVASSLDKGATGNAGDIKIEVGSLFLNNKAQIGSPTIGNGNAGKVFVKADKSISLEDSGILTTVEAGAKGDGGEINIKAGSLSLSKGAQFSTIVRGALGNLDGGKGNAGDINIDVSDTITLDGTGRGVRGGIVRSGIATSVRQGGVGASGNINIQTGSLLVQNGASLDSSTTAAQKAGDVIINARNFVTFIGNNTSIRTLTRGKGDAGNLKLDTNRLIIKDGAFLAAQSQGIGKAGDIEVNLGNNLLVENGEITTTSEQSSGGAINIAAKNIRLFDNGDISTNVFSGAGRGGDITLIANTILALGDSDILSFARDGRGGDIRFNTEGFFTSSQFLPASSVNNPDKNDRVDVNASGAISGNITGIPDTNFIQNSLTDLPNNQIDPNTLIANSCINRTGNQNNTFFITGKGGIPIRPNDASLPNYSTGKIRSLTTKNSRPWKIGDPIIEPTGVYKLPNGKLILSRECS
ncbi:MAG: filamentous hemagglutinin N-terminal domain-containing protein [Calothrix sp. MO_192.B10]|nr:filamentous hemagglutinin N-terminal domain-containing protein [Calothrix sp. MO_192.B10]